MIEKMNCRYGSKAWELLEELKRPPGAYSITSKRTYDAFQGTELKEILDNHNIDTLIIGGVMTNLVGLSFLLLSLLKTVLVEISNYTAQQKINMQCCETTARSAFTKNFNVIFLSDGTATATAEMHQASLLNLSYGFATIMDCEEAKEWVVRNNFE